MGNLEHLLNLLKIGQQFSLYPSKIYKRSTFYTMLWAPIILLDVFHMLCWLIDLFFERQQTIHIHMYIYSTVV